MKDQCATLQATTPVHLQRRLEYHHPSTQETRGSLGRSPSPRRKPRLVTRIRMAGFKRLRITAWALRALALGHPPPLGQLLPLRLLRHVWHPAAAEYFHPPQRSITLGELLPLWLLRRLLVRLHSPTAQYLLHPLQHQIRRLPLRFLRHPLQHGRDTTTAEYIHPLHIIRCPNRRLRPLQCPRVRLALRLRAAAIGSPLRHLLSLKLQLLRNPLRRCF